MPRGRGRGKRSDRTGRERHGRGAPAPLAPMAPMASATETSEAPVEPTMSALLAELKSRDLDGSSKKPKWATVPDIHLPRSKFLGDCTDTVAYKQAHGAAVDSDDSSALEVDSESVPIVTIVHVSDTHLKHHLYDSLIPDCDILIHSGDFGHKSKTRFVTVKHKSDAKPKKFEFWKKSSKKKKSATAASESAADFGEDSDVELVFPVEVRHFDEWVRRQLSRIGRVVFIGGNHEISFNGLSAETIRRHAAKHGTYLQDECCAVFGLKIYGSPWTSSKRMGFSATAKQLAARWKRIPEDTDILVTHMPPIGILDLVRKRKYDFPDTCEVCHKVHRKKKHWGSGSLLEEVKARVKPVLHLFGHVHDVAGFETIEGTTFVNSAMDMCRTPHKIRLVFDL